MALGQLKISVVGPSDVQSLVADMANLNLSTAQQGVVAALVDAMTTLNVLSGAELEAQQDKALTLLSGAFQGLNMKTNVKRSSGNVQVLLEPGENWEAGVSRIAGGWLAQTWPETAVVPEGGSVYDQLRAKASAELQYSRNMADEVADEKKARDEERAARRDVLRVAARVARDKAREEAARAARRVDVQFKGYVAGRDSKGKRVSTNVFL